MLILHNCAQVVTISTNGAPYKTGVAMRDVGVQTHASVVIDGKKFASVLPNNQIAVASGDEVIDCTGKVVLPGFVDSHTHAVFASVRAEEFAMRIEGRSYQEIAAAGGGIVRSMKDVRAATKQTLVERLNARLNEMLLYGTTTVEVKSGYGLSVESELKLLRAIRSAQSDSNMEIHPTFLGAHAVPPEYKGKQSAYVAHIIHEMLPVVGAEHLAEFCDVFCDEGYFTCEETEDIFRAAHLYGMRAKMHADELAHTGGAELAGRIGALSADHLLRVSDQGITALKHAGVVATLLPGTAYFLGMAYAPARKLIDSGVAVALASDFNPGSSPVYNMQMIISLACTQMKMTIEEALCAATINGAAALGRADGIGSIEPGKQADAVIFNVNDYREIAYYFGGNLVDSVIKNGTCLNLN